MLPAPTYTDDGVPWVKVPEVARLLGRRRRQLRLSLAALARRTRIDDATLSEGLNAGANAPLTLQQYGAVADALEIMTAEEFTARSREGSPDAAFRLLAARARTAVRPERPVPARYEAGPLRDGPLLRLEREAVALGLEGVPAVALTRLRLVAAGAAAAGNRAALWMARLNEGQVLVMLSRLEEAEAAFAWVDVGAEEAGHRPTEAFAGVLLAGVLYELGRYAEADRALARAERALEAWLPRRDLRGRSSWSHPGLAALHARDRATPPDYVWWALVHLRMKVAVERAWAHPTAAARDRALEAARESCKLAADLQVPTRAQDLLWRARALLLDDSLAGWELARLDIQEAGPVLRRGPGPAYLGRATGIHLAAGEDLHADRRALRTLFHAAEAFIAHGDARGLGPTYTAAALQLVRPAGRRNPGARAADLSDALRLGLAAAALHPYGLVRHQVEELLRLLPGETLAPRQARTAIEDLLAYRGGVFAPLADLAPGLWPGRDVEIMRAHLGTIPALRPHLPG